MNKLFQEDQAVPADAISKQLHSWVESHQYSGLSHDPGEKIACMTHILISILFVWRNIRIPNYPQSS